MKGSWVSLRFRCFQDFTHCLIIGGYNLQCYEVFARLQQYVLLRLNTVILSGI
ncbi:MAG: hypothetical protein J6W09_06265 [Bacteroidales bacterium]|nr:hypothetical protein [Bacteroidales bacterium]